MSDKSSHGVFFLDLLLFVDITNHFLWSDYTIAKHRLQVGIFYKSMNHNFGVEIQIRNNTSRSQSVKIGGCVYNSNNQPEVRWLGTKVIKSTSSTSYDFYVRENTFSKMKEGKYKIQFWINDKKVQREFFVVTYK